MAVGLRDEIEKYLRSAPLPQSVEFLRAFAEFRLDRQSSSIRLDYLADVPLSEDAQVMLINLLERQMNLSAGSLQLTHVPARYSFNLDLKEDMVHLHDIQRILTQYPEIRADVEMPRAANEKREAELRTRLYDVVPIFNNSARVQIAPNRNQGRLLTITLRPMTAVPDEKSIRPVP
jgi:hypothetical protein